MLRTSLLWRIATQCVCDKLSLTLVLPKVAHPPRVSTSHVVTCVPSRIFIDNSVAVRGLPTECRSSDRGLRMYGPPPLDFLCDARNVGAEAASLQCAARGEAVRRTDSKDVTLGGLGLGHCSTKETTLSGNGALAKRRPRLGCTESPLQVPRSRRRRHEHITRRIGHEQSSAARSSAPRQRTTATGSHSCSDPRCARPPSTQPTVEWPILFSRQGSRVSGKSRGHSWTHSWCSLRACSSGGGWLARHPRHWR